MHLTLFDIYPATLARVMLMFALMRRARQCDGDLRSEIEASVFYLSTTMLMPGYCHEMYADSFVLLSHTDAQTHPVL